MLVFKANDIFQRIQLKTASDFFWNPDEYNPDLSLYRALIAEFGTKYSIELIHFNDVYFKIRSEIIMTTNSRYKYKHTRKTVQYMKELENCFLKLQSYKTARCHEANIVLSQLVRQLQVSVNNP